MMSYDTHSKIKTSNIKRIGHNAGSENEHNAQIFRSRLKFNFFRIWFTNDESQIFKLLKFDEIGNICGFACAV